MSETQELPQGWEWTTLGAICHKPQYGWTTKANPNSGLVRLLRTTDITKGHLDWNTVPYCTDVPDDMESYILHAGDLVISRAGSVGFSYLLKDVPDQSVFASYLIRFRPQQAVSGQYLAYFLQTPNYWQRISEESVGIALANVNARKLEGINLPLPPLAEQRRIVAAIEQQFTRLDAGVAALKRAQLALKRYRAAVLKAAVEGTLTAQWRAAHPDVEPAAKLLDRILAERRAKWEADLRAKGKDPAKAKYEQPKAPDVAGLPALPEGWSEATFGELVARDGIFVDGDWVESKDQDPEGAVRLIQLADVGDGVFRDRSSRFLTSSKAEELGCTYLQPGDVLIARMPDPLGRACIYPGDIKEAVTVVDVCIVRTGSTDVDHRWLMYSINSPSMRSVIAQLQSGTTRQRISRGNLATIKFPLPPLVEQEQIVAEVERRLSVVAELEATVAANLKRAERLRQSILERAFSGRLVPQDPHDEPASALLERIRQEREVPAKKQHTRQAAPAAAAASATPSSPPRTDVPPLQRALWAQSRRATEE